MLDDSFSPSYQERLPREIIVYANGKLPSTGEGNSCAFDTCTETDNNGLNLHNDDHRMDPPKSSPYYSPIHDKAPVPRKFTFEGISSPMNYVNHNVDAAAPPDTRDDEEAIRADDARVPAPTACSSPPPPSPRDSIPMVDLTLPFSQQNAERSSAGCREEEEDDNEQRLSLETLQKATKLIQLEASCGKNDEIHNNCPPPVADSVKSDNDWSTTTSSYLSNVHKVVHMKLLQHFQSLQDNAQACIDSSLKWLQEEIDLFKQSMGSSMSRTAAANSISESQPPSSLVLNIETNRSIDQLNLVLSASSLSSEDPFETFKRNHRDLFPLGSVEEVAITRSSKSLEMVAENKPARMEEGKIDPSVHSNSDQSAPIARTSTKLQSPLVLPQETYYRFPRITPAGITILPRSNRFSFDLTTLNTTDESENNAFVTSGIEQHPGLELFDKDNTELLLRRADELSDDNKSWLDAFRMPEICPTMEEVCLVPVDEHISSATRAMKNDLQSVIALFSHDVHNLPGIDKEVKHGDVDKQGKEVDADIGIAVFQSIETTPALIVSTGAPDYCQLRMMCHEEVSNEEVNQRLSEIFSLSSSQSDVLEEESAASSTALEGQMHGLGVLEELEELEKVEKQEDRKFDCQANPEPKPWKTSLGTDDLLDFSLDSAPTDELDDLRKKIVCAVDLESSRKTMIPDSSRDDASFVPTSRLSSAASDTSKNSATSHLSFIEIAPIRPCVHDMAKPYSSDFVWGSFNYLFGMCSTLDARWDGVVCSTREQG